MKRHILPVILVLMSLGISEAYAFWGSDTRDPSSGLNVAAGFDVNTITTISGAVATPPERKGSEQHTVMTIATTQGTVTVVLGPWWYWEKQNLGILKNQEIAVTGSLAQGKDGALYIFTQRLENRSSGETLTLRTESGTPLWTRNGSGARTGARQSDSNGASRGAGNRNSGMRGGRR